MSSSDRIANLEALVAGLLEQVARLTAEVERLKPFEARVAVLEAENAALKAENAALKEKVAKSSRNSSKPPSSDGPKEKAERRTKKPTGRAAGGQPGHLPHHAALAPPHRRCRPAGIAPSAPNCCVSQSRGACDASRADATTTGESDLRDGGGRYRDL